MTSHYHIRYIPRDSIDTSKWDHCIDNSKNGLIYAESLYLDNMAKHWDGLVLNDYEAVMPLVWNKKWTIQYLYQPPLTPQLGIFSQKNIPHGLIEAFIKEIESRFKFAEIFFNYDNSHRIFQLRHNFILNLERSYERLASQYKIDLQKNLKRANRFEFVYTADFNLEEALQLHEHFYKNKTPHVRNNDYANFFKLCVRLQQVQKAEIRALLTEEKDWLSVVLLFKKKNRIYLIESTTSKKGRQMQANHFLLDAVIREFAGKDLILDFVGSDIPGIAHFYKNFGSVEQPYFFYKLNRLAWPARVLKK